MILVQIRAVNIEILLTLVDHIIKTTGLCLFIPIFRMFLINVHTYFWNITICANPTSHSLAGIGTTDYTNDLLFKLYFSGLNMNKVQLAMVSSKTKEAKLKITGGDFILKVPTRS